MAEGDEAIFSFSRSGVPWRKWLLLQHTVPPQSPLGVWPSPNAMTATPRSQYEEHGLSRQDEVLSTSRDQEDARSWL